jgi:hypothetical protein
MFQVDDQSNLIILKQKCIYFLFSSSQCLNLFGFQCINGCRSCLHGPTHKCAISQMIFLFNTKNRQSLDLCLDAKKYSQQNSLDLTSFGLTFVRIDLARIIPSFSFLSYKETKKAIFFFKYNIFYLFPSKNKHI